MTRYRSVMGVGLVLAGAAMLVLPGPGVLTIVAGLTLLERDVPAVGRWMAWLRGWWQSRWATTAA